MPLEESRPMKTIAISSIFVLFAIVAGIASTAPAAFADHATASVSIPAGTSVPGCEETKECYIPYTVTIDPGGEVTWSNDDSAAHTVTSGTAKDGPDGNFDSGLFMAGTTFPVKFDDYEPATYPYFCMVHPWMTGEVIVQAAGEKEEEEEMMEEEGEKTFASAMSADGSMNVEIESDVPTAGKELAITVGFTDADGNIVEHVNYDIGAIQGGTEVLSESAAHAMSEPGMHITEPLTSDSPVDVQVTILGIGFPGNEASWTGPQGDVVSLQVVPEFGTIAVMILGIAIVSIIAVTAKTRVIPKL